MERDKPERDKPAEIFIIIMACLIIFGLLVCFASSKKDDSLLSRAERGVIEYEHFADDVVVDEDTHILYIFFSDGESTAICPYYSKNGKLCRYDDGKIIEVE